MFGIGTGELVVILVVVILLFGAKRIPEIAKGIGRALHEFRKARDGLENAGQQPHDEKGKTDAG